MTTLSFSGHLSESSTTLTLAEKRVVNFLAGNRETALLASAAEMARIVGTSDATIIRTARKLGFSGLEELRQAMAGDLRRDLTLSERVTNDLSCAGGGTAAIMNQTIQTLRATLDSMERLAAEDLERAVTAIGDARCVHIFGIGPSGHLAEYFAAQLKRLGANTHAIRNTGLQFADDLINLKRGDSILALAYDRPYPEVTALFDRAIDLGLPSTLVTSIGPLLPDYRADLVLQVARGRPDGFGLHAGTLALLEGILVAYAAENHAAAQSSMDDLNRFRRSVSGEGMHL